eukprot:TRINITY_DN5593_c0_g1_i1.p1 TRINITY_DN5593_c0_g1~~TRINITY_DN5593_c0_g1_i1.p1  ORF type:complete len:151 (+),score=15.14 TRINITY_DN5593_c0_g1_i1:60-455(+)
MYFESVVIFSTVVYLFETYLDYRQHKLYKLNKIPSPLKGAITPEDYQTTLRYSAEKSVFGFFSSAYLQILSLAWLYWGVYPYLWKASAGLFYFSLSLFGADLTSYNISDYEGCLLILLILSVLVILLIPWN